MPVLRKHAVGGLLIAGALGYLAYSATGSAWVYFVGVDQYLREAPRAGQRARLHGIVGPDLRIAGAGTAASFSLLGATASLPVEYRGAVPESCAAARQVVVEGSIDQRGVFVADVLLTKCASKYDAGPGHPEGGS